MRRHISVAVLAVVPLIMLVLAACIGNSGPGEDEPHCACACQDQTGFVYDDNAFCSTTKTCLEQCNALSSSSVCTLSDKRSSTCQ